MTDSDPRYTPNDGDRTMSDAGDISDITAFNADEAEGQLVLFTDTSVSVKGALRRDLKESRMSRTEVALRLSRATGREIGQAMLDAYVAETKEGHRFPAELVPAWVYVMKSRRVLEVLCRQAGLSVATQEDREFAELGRAHLRSEKLARRLWARC